MNTSIVMETFEWRPPELGFSNGKKSFGARVTVNRCNCWRALARQRPIVYNFEEKAKSVGYMIVDMRSRLCFFFIFGHSGVPAFSSPEPTIVLACGRNRELWEQPFRACAIDEGWVKPDGQNSVISFVILKWLLTELSISAAGQKDHRLWGREWGACECT